MKPTLIIQNCEIESAGTILEYLDDRKIGYEICHLYKESKLPNPDKFEAVINLGCPCSVIEYTKFQYLIKLFEYVTKLVEQNKPYIGICFGGQILSKALGAEVKANPVKEIGTYKVRLTDAGKADSVFDGFDSEFSVFHWHGDTFDIPENAEQLVIGDDCPNQAFRYGSMIGVQFHLEADIKEVPLWCDEYEFELHDTGKTKENIIKEYSESFDSAKSNNFIFLDNFYKSLDK